MSANRAFHRVIAASTGNARLYAILEALADEASAWSTSVCRAGIGRSRSSTADEGHEALIAAFEARDAGAAERWAAEHVEHAHAIVLARILDGGAELSVS